MIPFYIFYSMFGFQRTGDEFWAFGDARGRGFVLGATAGRTTLNGEGLQHEDGHSLVMASVIPAIRVYDPAFAYETAVLVRDGIERMYGETPEDIFYYLTLYNENYAMPARPEWVTDEDIVRGLYRFSPAPEVGDEAAGRPPARATILAGGSIMQQALRAQQLLAERGVAAEVWSALSYQLLRNEALEADRWNRLHPDEEQKTPLVTVTAARAGRAGTDRRGERLHHGVAGHDRPLGSRRLVALAGHGRLRPKRHPRGAATLLRDRRRARRGDDPG